MAPPQRHPAAHLETLAALESEAPASLELQRLGFFGLVALLERLTPEAARVGGANPALEAIRFKHDPALAFSAQDLSRVRSETVTNGADSRRVYEVTATFLGLAGGSSPTPAYISEEVLRQEGRSLQDFLDLFHHRLLSLLYRELSRFKPWAEQTSQLNDPWSARLLALAGLDAYHAPLSADLPAEYSLRLLPLLARRERSSQSLAVALGVVLEKDIEGARVNIREFAGGWTRVPASQQTQLGIRSTQLGESALLGAQIRDPAGAFEVHIGPLSYDAFLRLSASQGPLQRIHALLGQWVRDPLEYRVVASLAPDQVPQLRLGAESGRLGRDAWLGRPMREAAVTVFPAL